jgi:hypothetical protein
MFPDTETSPESIGQPSNPWTSSPAAFRASPSLTPAVDALSRMLDGFGLSSPVAFAHFDPDSFSLRTSQDSFDLGSTVMDADCGTRPLSKKSLLTWPRSVTWDRSTVYQQPMSVRPIFGSESGLWPTPTTAPSRPNEGNVRLLRRKVLDGTLSEAEAEAMLGGRSPFEAQGKIPRWPTPTASDAKSSGAAGYPTTATHHSGTTLTDAIVRWPTPTARDWKDGGGIAVTSGKVPTNGLLGRAVFKTPTAAPWSHGGGGGELQKQINRFPTPTASDGSGGPGNSGREGGENLRTVAGGALNPTWVEWLMGFPLGWTDCDHLATPSFRKSLKSSVAD